VSDLGKLAYLIYKKLKREEWTGGKGRDGRWPEDLIDMKWGEHVTWTVSPPVEIGGHTFHVCISSNAMRHVDVGPSWKIVMEWKPKRFPTHNIRVFCGGELKYPGGKIEARYNFWPTWSAKIAKLEIRDGGKTGPIEKRDLLIRELKGDLNVVPITHQIEDNYSAEMERALKEVEAVGRKKETS